jgi:hypothetical protein
LLDTNTPFEVPDALRAAGHPLILTSAKTGQHVEDAFRDAASAILRRGY